MADNPKIHMDEKPVTWGEHCMGCGGPETPPYRLFHTTVGLFLTFRLCKPCMRFMLTKFMDS